MARIAIMTGKNEPVRIALLVDAENIAPQHMRQILAEVIKLGRPIIQFAFGDFSSPSMKSWVDYLRKNMIEARQVTPAECGKNAAVIALVVEAMALVCSGKCDAICIASSDRDFVPLTTFLRRANIDVYGFGEPKTDRKYRQTCTKFSELKAEPHANAKTETKPQQIKAAHPTPLAAGTNWPAILQEIARLATAKGWTSLQALGGALGKQGIHAKDHGGANWGKVLGSLSSFELRADSTGRRSVRIVASEKDAKAA